MIPLWKLIAKNWIEHPSRNGDLVSFGKLDYKTFLLEAAQGAHYFYFRSIKRMMSVMNLLERKFVSSMMIRRHNNHLFNIPYFIGNSCCPATVGGNFFPLCTP